MPAIPFCGQTYQDKTLNANAQRAINLYPMRTPQSQYGGQKFTGQTPPEKIVMYPTPGYSFAQACAQYATQGTAIRGLFVINNILYIVCGNVLLSFTPTGAGNNLMNGTFSTLGTLNTSSGIVSIVCNTVQLAISDTQGGYTYNLTTGVFASISGGSFPISGGVTNFTFYDGYVVGALNGSTEVIQSNALDATTWGAQAFDKITSFPDNLVGVFSDELILYCFGPRLCEVQVDVASIPYAFQKQAGVLIQAGCAAIATVVKVGNTIIWLAADYAGKSFVATLEGYGAKPISTPPINEAMERYSTVADAYAYTYREGDNQFYVITFPTAGATWAYDVKMDMWHERSINGGTDLPTAYVNWQGNHVVGDQYGNLLIMSQNYSTWYNGATGKDIPMNRVRTCQHLNADGKTMFIKELWVDMQQGGGFITDSLLASQPTEYYSSPAIVQTHLTFGTSPLPGTWGSNPITGNLLVAQIQPLSSGSTVSSVTDNKGQTWVSANARSFDTTGNRANEIWYCPNTVAGVTTVTVTFSGGVNGFVLLFEISGIQATSPLDAVGIVSNGTSSGTAFTNAASVSTTGNNDFILACYNSGTSILSCASPFFLNVSSQYMSFSPTGTFSGAPQFRTSVSGTFCASTVAFLAASSVTDTQENAPQAMLEVSKDYGNTWHNVGIRSIGKVGEYTKRVLWRALGRFRQNATFRLTVTDPVATYIIGARADIVVGKK